MLIDIDHLSEQLYKNLKRNYYFGTVSPKIFNYIQPKVGLFSDPDELPLAWFTTNVLYAMDYAGWNWREQRGDIDGKIYICNFTEQHNIFNANCRRDIVRIIRKSGGDVAGEQIKCLMHDDWFDMGKKFRKDIISACKDCGYQGIFNWEHGMAYAPSIGLFDTSDLIIKEIVEEPAFSDKFRKEIDNGDKRIAKGLLENSIIDTRNARQLQVPLSLLKESSERQFPNEYYF